MTKRHIQIPFELISNSKLFKTEAEYEPFSIDGIDVYLRIIWFGIQIPKRSVVCHWCCWLAAGVYVVRLSDLAPEGSEGHQGELQPLSLDQYKPLDNKLGIRI